MLFVGFGLAESGSVPLMNNSIALAGFIAGAIAASRIVRGRPHEPRMPTAHLLLLAGTAAAVVVLGILWLLLGTPADGRLLGLTGVLAAAMGMQAVAARGADVSDVTPWWSRAPW